MGQISFASQLEEFAEEYVPGEVVKFTKKIAKDGLRMVVDRSPVKSGRFRGNWEVGINSIPDEYNWHQYDLRGNVTKNRGYALIDAGTKYDIFYISNSLPYAHLLEMGWSMQAPIGIVGVTILDLENKYGR
jgi:hypothetical protein